MRIADIQDYSKQFMIYWSLVFLTFIACYYRVFLWFNYNYQLQDSYFSHGYLIPFVAAYLIYLKRDELKLLPYSNSYFGLGFIIFALLIHIFGVIGGIHFISGFSMVVYIYGCSLYLFGVDRTKKIAFPIFFLVFMCPIPNGIIDVIALPFKSMATSLSLNIIDLIGIPYIREGYRIHLPLSTFVVGTPCNGMRSLIAYLALSVLFLYYARSSFWKKLFYLSLVPPISITLNGLRIAILLWIANTYGEEAASPESYLHDGSGLFVFILGMLALMIFYRVIHDEK
jgi:exosortase